MDDDPCNEKQKYFNVLNRIQKKFSTYECILLMKRQYLTNNTFYYFLCLLFRFFYLIYISGNINKFDQKNKKTLLINSYIKKLTCLNLVQHYNISFIIYISIIIIIIVLLLLRLIMYYYIIKEFHENDLSNKWILPNKYLIIIEHIVFLFFPYMIEFFSLPYYILFFHNNFIPSINTNNNIILIIFIVLCSILIILYNIDNYIYIVCSNKIYTYTIYDAYSELKSRETNNKPVKYQCSNYIIYILIILQNYVIFLILGDFLKYRDNTIFKLITSLFFLFLILILFYMHINEFDYENLINITLFVLITYCFYSIIINSILFLLKYEITSLKTDMIYTLVKLILSYITYYLANMKSISYLDSKILQIIFQEKINKKKIYFMNCLYALHHKMLTIKMKKDINTAFLLTRLIGSHINECSKSICNCKLFDTFLQKKRKKKLNNEEITTYISELLIILNYLFECTFVDYDYYNNYNMCILLAEHYCYCKENPTMGFSLINTFILKQRNKFSKFEIVNLYELCQKYIYYIDCFNIINIEKEIFNNQKELLLDKQKDEEFKGYYNNLKIIYKAKGYICDYIHNEIRILKYKYIFEDSLIFKYDENNENITSVTINFFENTSTIDDSYSKYNNKKSKKHIINYNKSNLSNIIYLLKNDQLFYQKIINTIHLLDMNRGIPVDMGFKYILFFDIFEGGKMPNVFKDKFYQLLDKDANLYNNYITKNEYDILKKRYIEKNNRTDSEMYIIIELKRELYTKYFSEYAALKLGFQQKDIINEKIDKLMPEEFNKSHQNVIKHLVISQQSNFRFSKTTYYFDKTRTTLYSVNSEVLLIYNLTKSLFFIIVSKFIFEKDYIFLLNSNFDLLAITKNFEDEYYLNQSILQKYNINFLSILKLKPEKFHKIYKNELDLIYYQKMIRQIRAEEYIAPQLYVPGGEKTISMMNSNYFKSLKNNFLSKISKYNKDENNLNKNNNLDDDNEKEELLVKKNINNSLNDLLINPGKIILNKTYNTLINKGDFIENIAKELTKIPENDLMIENDKTNYNLIISSKKLINNLLTKSELINEHLKLTVKFNFYYDKNFYFISIEDEKKLYFNISKSFHFQKLNSIKNKSSSKPINYKKNIPYNKNSNQSLSRNKIKFVENTNQKYLIPNKKKIVKLDSELFNLKKKKVDEILNKINERRKHINRDSFITIIKWILTIIICLILIIYIVIIFFQRYLLNISKKMLFAYFHNAHIRQIVLYAHSRTIQIFYDYYNLTDNKIITEQEYQNIIKGEADTIKENYHNFLNLYMEFNSKLGNDYNILYDKKTFKKLRGLWKEEEYISDYSSEINFIVYAMYSTNVTNKSEEKLNIDMDNFIFFRGRNGNQKINTYFIKLLYYLCANYEFIIKDLFLNIDEEIFNLYKKFMNEKNKLYVALEIIGLSLYIINCLIVSFYLYSSNSIIIKNVIFLFLDFSEDKFKTKNNVDKIINLKLLEFNNIVDDFNINRLEKFSMNLDRLNLNKSLHKDDDDSFDSTKLSSDISNDKINISNKPSINSRNSINNQKYQNFMVNNGNFLESKVKNNSSHNYLAESSSQLDKLNNNSLNISKDLLTNKNKLKNQNLKIIANNKNNKNEETEKKENNHNILINKSNKSLVLLIKVYFITMLLLFLVIVTFIIYKIIFSLNCNLKFKNFFSDFTIITNRYAILYYYFNAIRTLLIYPDDERKKKYEKVMEGLNDYYEEENKKFLEVLSNGMDTYTEILELFNLLTISKKGLEEQIKEKVCGTIPGCNGYIDSDINIFTSGIDFGFKSCLKDLTDIYLDYQKLKNKTDFHEVNATIINSETSPFVLIGVGLGSCIMYVINKIFELFKIDVTTFNESFSNNTKLLNEISIVFSILTFLFVIFLIIISITNYIKPIKEATYRINCSFFYIKKFSLN